MLSRSFRQVQRKLQNGFFWPQLMAYATMNVIKTSCLHKPLSSQLYSELGEPFLLWEEGPKYHWWKVLFLKCSLLFKLKPPSGQCYFFYPRPKASKLRRNNRGWMSCFDSFINMRAFLQHFKVETSNIFECYYAVSGRVILRWQTTLITRIHNIVAS